MLADFGIKFRFLTTTLGVDPTYEAEPFYRPTLDADSQRVNKLFDQAAARGISIERLSMSPDALQVALGFSPRAQTRALTHSPPATACRCAYASAGSRRS